MLLRDLNVPVTLPDAVRRILEACPGFTFATRPQVAGLSSPKMPPSQPQSPTATTSFGSGVAS